MGNQSRTKGAGSLLSQPFKTCSDQKYKQFWVCGKSSLWGTGHRITSNNSCGFVDIRLTCSGHHGACVTLSQGTMWSEKDRWKSLGDHVMGEYWGLCFWHSLDAICYNLKYICRQRNDEQSQVLPQGMTSISWIPIVIRVSDFNPTNLPNSFLFVKKLNTGWGSERWLLQWQVSCFD